MLRILFAVLSTISLTAQTYYSVPPADAPELAARGRFSVGVRTLELVHPGQPDILHFDRATGKAPLYDRPLNGRGLVSGASFRRARRNDGVRERHARQAPATDVPKTFRIAGKALRDAPPAAVRASRW